MCLMCLMCLGSLCLSDLPPLSAPLSLPPPILSL